MTRGLPTLRAASLIGVASLVLHELRYVLGYGSHADETLAAHGHGYLSAAGVGAAVLLALAAARLLALVARAWRTGVGERGSMPFGVAWLAAGLMLTGVYTGQELLEGAFAAGHPAGLDAIAAHGGLVAYPLAFALGAVVALTLRGARALVAAAARRGRRTRPPRASWRPARSPLRLDLPLPGALATGRAVRAPPLAS
jgi:hypothetical protein